MTIMRSDEFFCRTTLQTRPRSLLLMDLDGSEDWSLEIDAPDWHPRARSQFDMWRL